MNFKLFKLLISFGGELFLGLKDRFFRFGVNNVLTYSLADDSLRKFPIELAFFRKNLVNILEKTEDFFVRAKTQSPEKNRGQELLFPV